MLTREQNDRLTRIGPGTPGGELMRRYWQPLCAVEQLRDQPHKKRVRILGEDLVVFRKADGGYSCVQEKCPHRNASMYFAFVEPDGIRCCYHGWKFDCDSGRCIDRPFETAQPHPGLRLRAYPVQELGDLLFVYMGPDPAKAPLLPHWDVLVRTDQPRKIVILPLHHCNWLQIQENTADSVHTFYLHGHTAAVMGLMGSPDARLDAAGAGYFYRPIVKFDYEPCEWGLEKTIEYGGDRPELEIRPPLIFPNILRIPQGPVETIHFRVPVDDTTTRIFWVGLLPSPKFAQLLPLGGEVIAATDDTYIDQSDEAHRRVEDEVMSNFFTQDRVVMETQGAIADRSTENLGASDRGIVMYRRMLAEQIDRVERGEDPTLAVVRDPEQNRCIVFPSATRPIRSFPRADGDVLSTHV